MKRKACMGNGTETARAELVEAPSFSLDKEGQPFDKLRANGGLSGATIGLAALLALAACGDVQGLTPRKGAALPVQGATNATRPDADHLLQESAQERPGRSDELLLRSQVRPSDRFDLPPQ